MSPQDGGRAAAWAGELVAAALVFAVSTFTLLFPLFAAPGSTLFDPAIRGSLSLFALGDIYTVIWVMAWDAHALWSNPAGLFDANIFHPAPGALTSSEHMLGHLPIFAPLYAVSGNAVLAHQLNLFAGMTLCGVSMYALLRHWGTKRIASFAAGVAFAYCPLRLTIVTHAHLVAGQYLVFAMIAFDRFLLDGKRRWAVALAILVAMQCLCSFYLAYMSLVGLTAYGVAALAVRRDATRMRRVGVAALSAAIGLIPFFMLAIPYLTGRDVGTLPETQAAELLRYLSVRPSRLFTVREEGYYVGLAVSALALLGAISPLPRARFPWLRLGALAIAAVSIAFSIGPAEQWWDWPVPSPYDLASWTVPGFSAMRAPSRFVLIVMVGMAALAGLGVDRLARLPRVGLAAALAALFAVVWDYQLLARSFPVRPAEVGASVPAVYRALAELPRGPVVEIPAGGGEEPIEQGRESEYTFRSIYHWQPLLNGRTGYVPQSYPPLMALARALPDPKALELLQRAAGLRYVVVHFKKLVPGEWSKWRKVSGLRRVRRYQDAVLFEVERQTPADLVGSLLARPSGTSVGGAPLAPLRRDQRNGRVRVVNPPATVQAGLPLALALVIENGSSTVWPAFTPADEHRVGLGYRWRDGAGRVVASSLRGDRLPYDLAPGESVRVLMSVPVGVEPGDYELGVAVAQDRVWFEDASISLPVTVVPYRAGSR